jgi:Flp pilus assembly protein TadG
MYTPHLHRSLRQRCPRQARRPHTTLLGSENEDGQALVEFALVLPILLLVVFGIVQFGLALNSANNQTQVANAVARYAIVDENPGAKENESLQQWGKSQEYQNSTSLSSEGKVCLSFPSGKEVGDPVEVVVTSTTNWLPVLNVGPSTTITGKAYMRLEAAPTNIETAAECA